MRAVPNAALITDCTAHVRSNLSFAALTMKADLHLSNTECAHAVKSFVFSFCISGRRLTRYLCSQVWAWRCNFLHSILCALLQLQMKKVSYDSPCIAKSC